MRQIKFRGKRIDNGKWVYGYYSYDCKTKHTTIGYIIKKSGFWEEYIVDPETVG